MRMRKTPFDGIDRTTKFITLGWGSIVQRLFSTFPSHLPGVGLLLMRLSLGITLICLAAAILLEQPPAANSLAPRIIGVVAGVFVIAGLWTPLAATLAAFDQFWIPLSFLSSQKGGEWIHIVLAILCASVAMLGPGAWSVDALLFGRKAFPPIRPGRQNHPPKG
jgi:putative oxidoreductase